jgi:hypothetical protein
MEDGLQIVWNRTLKNIVEESRIACVGFVWRLFYTGCHTCYSYNEYWPREYARKDNVIHKNKKLHGLSPRANYTDRATAACRRSDCQLLRIEGTTWSA